MTESNARRRSLSALMTILLVCGAAELPDKTATATAQELNSKRVAEIAGMLNEKPAGFGVPIGNRRSWGELARNESFAAEISDAERLLSEPIPEQSDDLYLDFSRTGNRTRWQKVSGQRRGRVPTLTVAECIENKGRFLPALAEIVRVLCSERTWVMPAHDAKLTNFRGETVDIDLGSSALAWSLATADYLLADKLSPEIRRLIAENLESRIFQPYRDMVLGNRPKNWWMTGTNNWNAVCLAGVTGAALAAIDSRDDRAFFVAAAEHYSKNFLEGFTDDGYCSEGLGYWNYGFGHYVMLNEMIHQATGGKIELLQEAKAKQAATFGSKIEIINGVYPAFADCSISAEPGSRLMYYVSRRLGLGLSRWEQIDPVSAGGSLYESMMYSFANAASETPPILSDSEGPGTRSWFDQAGVLICRPAANSAARMAVALKGGHNNEHHNHNDVGSFVVVLGDKALLLDPGGEVYTARTFSSRRYESNVLNSFGHPVPLVAGKLQRTGSQARARLVGQRFTEDADILVFDIASAYDVPELKKLQRTFVYSRIGAGSLSVTDEVAFSKPCDFGTALVTFEAWQQLRDSSLAVSDGTEALRVSIMATGAGFEIKPEVIHEDLSARKEPTRLGINLTRPVTEALVSLTITPQEQRGAVSDARTAGAAGKR
ncbi:MAG TPA: heparinase II/III family protein [Sedimentisphaerales bacterium]|nr:heparinase II/III family protein [Sedimentisphaerales bacterium]